MSASMRGWRTRGDGRLELEDLPVPRPADDEVLVRVIACGVCRTDLHVRDGDLAPHRTPVVPGHEVVGQVVATGARTVGSRPGDLVGVLKVRADTLDRNYLGHWARELHVADILERALREVST